MNILRGEASAGFPVLLHSVSQWVVRGCGFVVLFVGLWVTLKVVHEALTLYADPSRIEVLADFMERSSNLDKNMLSVQQLRGSEAPPSFDLPPGNVDPASQTASDYEAHNDQLAAPDLPPRTSLRLTYFVAWIVELLLLLLVARIGLAAIKTGGELVLYKLPASG